MEAKGSGPNVSVPSLHEQSLKAVLVLLIRNVSKFNLSLSVCNLIQSWQLQTARSNTLATFSDLDWLWRHSNYVLPPEWVQPCHQFSIVWRLSSNLVQKKIRPLRCFTLTRKASTMSNSANIGSFFESSDGGVTKAVDKRLHYVGITSLSDFGGNFCIG